jgi:hypothetical protein
MLEQPKNDVAGPAVDLLRARREAAMATLAKAEEKKDETTQLRELAMLEQRAEWTEKGGEEGVDWKVIDGGAAGPIVLKLPDHGRMVMFKRFRAPIDDPKNGKITLESSMQFVAPCVGFPERAAFLELCERHPGLIYDLANDLHAMFGRNEAAERGK